MNIITRGYGSNQMIVTRGYGGITTVTNPYARGDPSILDPLKSTIYYQ